MEKIDILLWLVGGGFTFSFGLMSFMWASMGKMEDRLADRIKETNEKIDKVEKSLGARIDKLDEKLTDVDRRLCRIEGSLAARDYCVLKEDHRHKKAE